MVPTTGRKGARKGVPLARPTAGTGHGKPTPPVVMATGGARKRHARKGKGGRAPPAGDACNPKGWPWDGPEA